MNPTNDENKWNHISDKFFYHLDFTPATGHYSKPNLFINNYLHPIKAFLRQPNKVIYRCLVYTEGKNKAYYGKLLAELPEFKGKDITQSPDKDNLEKLVEENLIIANDVFLEFLNQDKNLDQIDYSINKDYKIYYKPFRKTEYQIPKNNPIGKEIAKKEIKVPLYSPSAVLTDDEGNNTNYCLKDTDVNEIIDSLANKKAPKYNCFVLQTDEIGLSRFIVTNLFVIQFIAFKKQDSSNVPAGYISEDVTIIKRYKKAFEDYLAERHS